VTSEKDKKRSNLDTRPTYVAFKNYDYAGPDEGNEISPGKGLYNSKMNRYKSVKDFLQKKRESRAKLKNAKLTAEQILKGASKFVNLVAQQTTSGTAYSLSESLNNAGVWGGSPFDINGPVANKIFAIFDKYNFKGKISATVTVDNKLNVKINVTGADGTNVPQAINSVFSTTMSNALKKSKAVPPTETMTFGWLEDVGY
jgi:hypothetical protein